MFIYSFIDTEIANIVAQEKIHFKQILIYIKLNESQIRGVVECSIFDVKHNINKQYRSIVPVFTCTLSICLHFHFQYVYISTFNMFTFPLSICLHFNFLYLYISTLICLYFHFQYVYISTLNMFTFTCSICLHFHSQYV